MVDVAELSRETVLRRKQKETGEKSMDTRPIGMFDSGVGGLTVMKQFQKLLPDENIIYFADTAHVPIGDRSREELIFFVRQILDFLQEQDIKAAVFACNTTSALVLNRLKADYPFPMIGTIRAGAREAVRQTKNKQIGIIATNNTVKSHAFASFIQMEDISYKAFELGCPRLVPLIESGYKDGPEVRAAVADYVNAMKEKKVDTLILGCTHYPFLAPVIADTAGKSIHIVDPALETSKEMAAVLQEQGLLNGSGKKGYARFYASGDAQAFKDSVDKLLPGYVDEVLHQSWE